MQNVDECTCLGKPVWMYAYQKVSPTHKYTCTHPPTYKHPPSHHTHTHIQYVSIVRLGSCAVEKTIHGANSAGIPSYRGRTQITSSCQANDNCQNSVHVISTYESTSATSPVRTGEVSLRVSVTGEDTRPLILVLVSFFAIRWCISVPRGVVFEKVIVVRKSLCKQTLA